MPSTASSVAPFAAVSRESTLTRACAATALTAALFCLVVLGVLLVQHFRAKTDDPLKFPPIMALKDQLRATPKDEQLKQTIRAVDLQLRERFFRFVALNREGRWLILGGMVMVVLAGKRAARLWSKVWLPAPNPELAQQAIQTSHRARWAVGGVAALVGVTFLALSWTSTTLLPSDAAGVDKLLAKATGGPPTEVADGPTLEEVRRNWPRFRGPEGSGLSLLTNVPLTWDATNGTGVVWKSPVPAPGWGSPVVWGDRVFLSGGDAARRQVFCFAASSGALVWQRAIENVPGGSTTQPDLPESTGFAAPTMATDGRRAYVIFGNGDLAALTFDGQVAWAKGLGVPRNAYGHASSLAVWQGRLLVQLDQGDVEDRKSKLYALDGPSGQVAWERNRQVPNSWATPIVIEVGGQPQVITLAVPWVTAYGLADGNELWRADCLNGEVTPSPVFAGGVLLAISPSEKLVALRPDGQGDVTKTHLLWAFEDNVPDISSPVSNGELVFMVSTSGMLTCLELKDGKKLWEQDLAMECNASPSVVGGRLYVFGKEGGAVVAEAGRQYKELARAELGEPVLASPAFAPGRIYVRSATNLFCLGARPAPAAKRLGGAQPRARTRPCPRRKSSRRPKRRPWWTWPSSITPSSGSDAHRMRRFRSCKRFRSTTVTCPRKRCAGCAPLPRSPPPRSQASRPFMTCSAINPWVGTSSGSAGERPAT
jgi:outer membrane protein assembly factor BamB